MAQPSPESGRQALAERLEAGLEGMGLGLDQGQQQQLLDYLALLEKWNRAYNLTAVDDSRAMVDRHLLESLTLLPWVHGPRLLDMGSGAGLPGLPLAIARPELEVTLVDSVGKKVRFLNHVTRQLGLENLTSVHARLEQFSADAPFNTITARALAGLDRLCAWAAPCLAEDGVLLAAKGPDYASELEAIPKNFSLDSVQPVSVPGLPAERHVVIMRPFGNMPRARQDN